MAAQAILSSIGTSNPSASQSALDGLEAQLWAAADALRNHLNTAEYKHAGLELIFLKSISDAFEACPPAATAAKKAA
ncbi:MAG: type I restriction-modification system subunit M N-terminal domain-containing protein [Acidobacteriota bacterium]